MTIKNDKDDADRFWSVIESKLYCKVPEYIKNLLRINGLDNAAAIQSVNDEVIEQLELFAKSGSMLPYIPQNADLKDFFWIFHKIQDKFLIVPGHKILLKCIVAYVVEQNDSNGLEFFTR